MEVALRTDQQPAKRSKTIVITGGTKGIGRAMGLALAADGHNVILNYHRDQRSAEEALCLCQQANPTAMVAKADVGDRQDVGRLFETASRRFGTVDVLINNAGQNIDKPLAHLSDEDWDEVIRTNLRGVFLCSQTAASYMIQQPEGGVILNVGASTGIQGRRDGVNYCASKAGVMVMTKCLALELAPRIRVNTLIPGLIASEEVVARFELSDPAKRAEKDAEIPLGYVAEVAEVGPIVRFLISEAARYITGQKLFLDGGQFMY